MVILAGKVKATVLWDTQDIHIIEHFKKESQYDAVLKETRPIWKEDKPV